MKRGSPFLPWLWGLPGPAPRRLRRRGRKWRRRHAGAGQPGAGDHLAGHRERRRRTAPARSIRRPPPTRTATPSPSRSPAAPTGPTSRSPPRGALSFAQNPDFEFPADADQNNVYLVQIAVSDGKTSATLDLDVTVTNAGPDAFRVARVGTGFGQPLYLTGVPDGSGRVFVVQKEGRIRILNPATGAIAADPVPRSDRPDLDRRRARPARLRAGAGFQRHRHLLRLSDRARRPDPAAALPDPAGQPRTRPIPPPPTSSSPSLIRSTTIMAAGSTSGRTGCSIWRSATAAAAATRATMRRTP